MVLTYITQIKSELVELMNENISLFNKMHEGVVVVSEKDQKLQFVSKPTVNLLKQEPERGILDETAGKLDNLDDMTEIQQ